MKKIISILLALTIFVTSASAMNIRFDRESDKEFVTVWLDDQGYSYVRQCEEDPEFMPALNALLEKAKSGQLQGDAFTQAFIELEQSFLNKIYAEEDKQMLLEVAQEFGVEVTVAQCRFDKATGTVLEVLNDGVVMEIPATIDGVTVVALGENAVMNKTKLRVLSIPQGVQTFDKVMLRNCPNLEFLFAYLVHVTAKPWANCPKISTGQEYHQSSTTLFHRTSVESGSYINFGKSFAVASGTIVGTGNGYGWEKNLTRAEALTIILRLMGLDQEAKAKAKEKPAFTDIMSKAAWVNGYTNLAYEKGITKGVGGGRFDPQGQCSAQDFITMVFRLTDLAEGKDYSWSTAIGDYKNIMLQTEQQWRNENDGVGFSQLPYFFEFGNELFTEYISLTDDFCRGAAVDVIWTMLHVDAGANHLSLADILASRYGMSEQVLYDHYARRSANGLPADVIAAIQKESHDVDVGAYHYFRSADYQKSLDEKKDFSLYNTAGMDEFAIKFNEAYYLGKDGEAIRQKAQEICAGLTTDAQKARAISEWICSHIFYDSTNYFGGTASEALKNRYGVCHTYASLTLAMCHAMGIPCTYSSSATHAWNNIFWDGKWHLVDNTWVSRLRYNGGQFYNGETPVANYMEPGPSQRDETYYDGKDLEFFDEGDHSILRQPMAQFIERTNTGG